MAVRVMQGFVAVVMFMWQLVCIHGGVSFVT
jgi:hypothetical protein